MTNDSHQPESSSRIESEQHLREFYGDPSMLSQQKFLAALDCHCQAMIARSSFVCVATRNRDGRLDISPRGDPPGSVVVLDPGSLLLPDRRGNNRLDTLGNITDQPEIALLFLVLGMSETLRVMGTAELIHDDPRLAVCSIDGQIPRVGILVHVEQACLQCGKAVKRGRLWDESFRVSAGDLPSFGQMLADQTRTGKTAEELDQSINQAYRERLY